MDDAPGGEPHDPEDSAPHVTEPLPQPAPPGRSSNLPWVVAAVLAVVAAGLVAALITVLNTSNARFDDLAEAVEGLDQHVGDVARRVDSLGAQVAAGPSDGASPSPAPSPSPQAPATSGIPGGLPLFESTQNDPAVLNGVVLGEVSGTDYYSGEEATYSPEDGKARVWMVWAHWCPYCQAELPDVSAWYVDNAGAYPNTELVSVTTSIDPSRGNPLEAYLDESAFPFPVLVDPDYRLASQFGTSAFPYWVITDAEGRVLLRVAGQMGVEQIEQIFNELEDMTANA